MSKIYGSLDNRMLERTFQKVPEVGMGATMTMYSDRHAYTILEISKNTVTVTRKVENNSGVIEEITRTYPKYIIASRDDFKVIKGSEMNDSAEYEYTTNPSKPEKFIFHKNSGKYRKEVIKIVKCEEDDPNKLRGFINLKEVGTNRTNQEQSCLIIGFKERYYDPCF